MTPIWRGSGRNSKLAKRGKLDVWYSAISLFRMMTHLTPKHQSITQEQRSRVRSSVVHSQRDIPPKHPIWDAILKRWRIFRFLMPPKPKYACHNWSIDPAPSNSIWLLWFELLLFSVAILLGFLRSYSCRNLCLLVPSSSAVTNHNSSFSNLHAPPHYYRTSYWYMFGTGYRCWFSNHNHLVNT